MPGSSGRINAIILFPGDKDKPGAGQDLTRLERSCRSIFDYDVPHG